MIKKGDKNVYEASLDRMKFIFEEFENVLVAFSCGKDIIKHVLIKRLRCNIISFIFGSNSFFNTLAFFLLRQFFCLVFGFICT